MPLAPSPSPRLSRSQWMAVGSALVTMGCSSQGGTPRTAQTTLDNDTIDASTGCGTDASATTIASSDASDDASAVSEAGPTEAGPTEAGLAEAGPAGPCGTGCNGWNQLCLQYGLGDSCPVAPNDAGYSYADGGSCFVQCLTVPTDDESDGGDAASFTAATVQTCTEALALADFQAACTYLYEGAEILPVCPYGSCSLSCTATTGNVYQIGTQCGGCYGAPPPRLDRLADA